MQTSDHDLRTLIEKSAQGDADCCKRLYECLVDKIYPYVHHRTSNGDEATDLTQDVFIDLFAALSNFTYQSNAQFYAFVFVIAKRKLAKHYEEKNNRLPQNNSMPDESVIASDADLPTHLETSHDVERALTNLDETTREIVVLRHWSRHSFGEIAALLEMTESAVRVRHHRALQTLADIINRAS